MTTDRADQTSPIQLRAIRTRAALLATVDRIVAVDGHAAVTTTRVAEAAGVAVGTLYRYFTDRDALLLAAYDASVERIVSTCAARLKTMPSDITMEQAAISILRAYLETAVADPAHAGLLYAMRSIRPTAADQRFDQNDSIMAGLMGPFLQRYGGGQPSELDLRMLRILLGTLVDLYLISAPGPDRDRIAGEIEAHMLLGLQRASFS